AVAPLPDLLRRGDGDPDRRERERVLRLFEEIEDVLHAVPPLVGAATRTAPRDFSESRDQPRPPTLRSAGSVRVSSAGTVSSSSTSRPRACISLTSTLNDSGKPDLSVLSPLMIAS